MCSQKLSNIAEQNSFLNENVPIYTSINDLEIANLLEKEEMNKILVEIESDHDTVLITSLEQDEVFEEDALNNQEKVFDIDIFD